MKRAALLLLVLVAGHVVAAPDEVGYGRDAGFPVGQRANFTQQRHLVGSFSAMGTLFPVRAVAAGATARPLERHDKASSVERRWRFIDDYLDSHPATGLLVLKDGKPLAERDQYGRNAEHLLTSFSMAKTLVAMAVGIALAEGRIASIDDALDKYEPALAASAWKGVSVRHALHMASGVKFDESYDTPNTDIAIFSRPWTRQEGRFLDALQTLRQTDAAPGNRFKYVSADTQALAQF